jgi:uncharacterized peroxidase-related enzyme
MNSPTFLALPDETPEARRLYEEDRADLGYVMNISQLWAYNPELQDGLFELLGRIVKADQLDMRQRGILVTATASARRDSYCSLAWGGKLTKAADAATAAAVLSGADDRLDDRERAMAHWARKVAQDPNGTTEDDIRDLRDAGFTDAQIFRLTVFVALRLAFSTVNDALGALPDAAYRSTLPAEVLGAVTFGRPLADE